MRKAVFCAIVALRIRVARALVGLRPIHSRRVGIIPAVVGPPDDRAALVAQGAATHRGNEGPTLLAMARHPGTEISNPLPSSGESANFRFRARCLVAGAASRCS